MDRREDREEKDMQKKVTNWKTNPGQQHPRLILFWFFCIKLCIFFFYTMFNKGKINSTQSSTPQSEILQRQMQFEIFTGSRSYLNVWQIWPKLKIYWGGKITILLNMVFGWTQATLQSAGLCWRTKAAILMVVVRVWADPESAVWHCRALAGSSVWPFASALFY